jgi:hypothetical protein
LWWGSPALRLFKRSKCAHRFLLLFSLLREHPTARAKNIDSVSIDSLDLLQTSITHCHRANNTKHAQQWQQHHSFVLLSPVARNTQRHSARYY